MEPRGWTLAEIPELPIKVRRESKFPKRRVDEDWEAVGLTVKTATGGYAVLPRMSVVGRSLESTGSLPADKLLDRFGGRGKGMKLWRADKKQTPRSVWEKETLTMLLKKSLRADDGYWAKRVINALILKAAKGNPQAQKVLWDRAEGVLTEKLNLSGEVTLQKSITLVDLRDVPELPECARDIHAEVKREGS